VDAGALRLFATGVPTEEAGEGQGVRIAVLDGDSIEDSFLEPRFGENACERVPPSMTIVVLVFKQQFDNK